MVIGASENPYRYSYKAVRMLIEYGHEVLAIGKKEGKIENIPIITGLPHAKDIHTVTLYIGKQHQPEYYQYLTEIVQPKRIIFNPGTENEELETIARTKSIEVLHHCTLIMLRSKEF